MRTSGFAVFRGGFCFASDTGSDDDEGEGFWTTRDGFSRTVLVENARALVPRSERANMERTEQKSWMRLDIHLFLPLRRPWSVFIYLNNEIHAQRH
jgi:hypothetical protein